MNSIEEYYQELVDSVPPEYQDCIEAKETWWEYNQLIEQQLADEANEHRIPDEIYDLKDSWG